MAHMAIPIRRHLEDVLEESEPPTDEYDGEQSKSLAPREVLEAEMAVPRQGHEDVGEHEQEYCPNAFHGPGGSLREGPVQVLIAISGSGPSANVAVLIIPTITA